MSQSSFYKYKLKENLQEIHDFITLPLAAWQFIASWYGYDFRITKDLVKDSLNKGVCVLNIYPDESEYDVEISRNPSYFKYLKNKSQL